MISEAWLVQANVRDYDAQRAMQMIEALGYTKDADGIFRDPNNERLTVEVRTTSGDDLRDKLLFALGNEWPALSSFRPGREQLWCRFRPIPRGARFAA